MPKRSPSPSPADNGQTVLSFLNKKFRVASPSSLEATSPGISLEATPQELPEESEPPMATQRRKAAGGAFKKGTSVGAKAVDKEAASTTTDKQKAKPSGSRGPPGDQGRPTPSDEQRANGPKESTGMGRNNQTSDDDPKVLPRDADKRATSENRDGDKVFVPTEADESEGRFQYMAVSPEEGHDAADFSQVISQIAEELNVAAKKKLEAQKKEDEEAPAIDGKDGKLCEQLREAVRSGDIAVASGLGQRFRREIKSDEAALGEYMKCKTDRERSEFRVAWGQRRLDDLVVGKRHTKAWREITEEDGVYYTLDGWRGSSATQSIRRVLSRRPRSTL